MMTTRTAGAAGLLLAAALTLGIAGATRAAMNYVDGGNAAAADDMPCFMGGK
jgi:hypothetical protein